MGPGSTREPQQSKPAQAHAPRHGGRALSTKLWGCDGLSVPQTDRQRNALVSEEGLAETFLDLQWFFFFHQLWHKLELKLLSGMSLANLGTLQDSKMQLHLHSEEAFFKRTKGLKLKMKQVDCLGAKKREQKN